MELALPLPQGCGDGTSSSSGDGGGTSILLRILECHLHSLMEDGCITLSRWEDGHDTPALSRRMGMGPPLSRRKMARWGCHLTFLEYMQHPSLIKEMGIPHSLSQRFGDATFALSLEMGMPTSLSEERWGCHLQ